MGQPLLRFCEIAAGHSASMLIKTARQISTLWESIGRQWSLLIQLWRTPDRLREKSPAGRGPDRVHSMFQMDILPRDYFEARRASNSASSCDLRVS
jgi:hypothetical protein